MQRALSRATTELLLQRPFFGHILCGLERRIVPGAALRLRVDQGRFILQLGLERVRTSTPAQLRGLLLHALLHLALRHPQRQQQRPAATWQLACDLVIAPLIPPDERAEDHPLPQDFGFREHLSAEAYHALLDADPSQAPGPGDGLPHPEWAELGDGPDVELAQQRLATLIQSAWARRGPPGLLPSALHRAILQWLGVPSVPWSAELRRFEARAQRQERKPTLHRRSRRYGTVPGLRTGDRCRLVVVLDTSGSIGPQELSRFGTELRALSATGTELFLVLCDAAVHARMPFTGTLPEQIPGGGGTDLEPGLQAALEYDPDGVILFTDGGLPPLRTRAPCPLLWLLTPDGLSDPYRQGEELRLPPS